jgi:hypothetical protein
VYGDPGVRQSVLCIAKCEKEDGTMPYSEIIGEGKQADIKMITGY